MPKPTLAYSAPALLQETSITCLDVGGRGGVQEFFLPYLDLIQVDAFEPDSPACEAAQKSAPAHVNFFPVALGKETETVPFYLTKRASGSSLYEPNPDMMYRYSNAAYGDIDKVLDMDVMSYSDFRQKYDRPHANIVKIDTQGSELEILQSFSKEDFNEVVCVLAEVEFVEMYKDQPLFHDIDQYMQSNQFSLFDLRTARCYLTKDQERDHYLKKLGYGTGTNQISSYLMAGDALYFRKFEDNCPKDQKTFIQLLLSYLMFLYFDHALELIELGLKHKVIDQDQYTQLENFVITMVPKPKLTERKGAIYDILRRILRKVGLHGPYQAFWQARHWPHQ